MEVDFAAIVRSDIWKEQIVPWLGQLLEDTHLDMETEQGAETYREKQGYCRAIRAVMTMPEYMTTLRKEEENGGQPVRRPGRFWRR